MDFTTSNLLVPTNSRRRTKGRLPFIDSAEPVFPNEDEKLQNEMNLPENELEYDFSENLDDVDEEQVTIDLSEFLNENPLLTEPSENLADSGATLTDCHSQFRVTSSLADPTPVVIEEISSQKDSNVNEATIVTEKCSDIRETESIPSTQPVSEMPPNVLSENKISIDSTKIPTDITNISPHKENILTGVKSSPIKSYKTKPTKTTNLFQKYKNASRLKDFNKNNMKVFGKYPVVKCEKLDIENFIKTNSIKVGNWPIMPTTNHFKTKSYPNKSTATRKYKSQASKVPKLLNKPISFNRCVSNSRNMSTVNKARSILIDALAANSSPLIIKTDHWKPEVSNLTGGSTKFLNSESFQLPTPQKFSKPVGNQRIIKLVHASSPLQINKLNSQTKKLPIITSVNKVTVGPKTFQLISPNTFVASKPEKSKVVTPILPKPNTETISPVFLKDYTVIQPYVEDPTSPVKPKPLLTVPLDIVPVANAFNQPELISTATEIHSPIRSPLKLTRPVQSVFLNGAISQISSPVAIGKEPPSINMTELTLYNEETTLSNKMNKTNDQLNVDSPKMSSNSSMIDAVTSIFSKPQVRKQPKNKQNHVRANRRGDSSNLECKAYNTTLNDMLFNDFTDESYSLDDSINISSDIPTDESNNILQSSHAYGSDQNEIQEGNTKSSSLEEKRKVKVFSKQKYNRKKIPSPHDSDTLSASEGEEESNQRQKWLSYSKRKHKTLSINALHNHKKSTESSETLSVFDGSDKNSSKKLVRDSSTDKNVTSAENRNNQSKRAEVKKSVEKSPKSLKLSKEKCLSSYKSTSSKPSLEASSTRSKSETSSISNTNLQIDDEKFNDPILDDAHEKLKTVQESKIGVSNLRNRHKTALKCQTAIALVKSKRIGFVRAKLKVNSKKMSNKVMRNNKKSSRPSDIINEIKTITGENISSKRLRKKKSTVPEKENHSSFVKNISTTAKNETTTKTVSKAPNQSKKSLTLRSKTKKRIKTLKVLFKRPTPKSKSLEIPFDDINDELLDNENDPNSLSENNTNLNSTFRDAKSHKMGTPSKEEHKCDADLSTKLKSDDSLKENEILSNGFDDNSSVESPVLTEGGDSIHGESNITTFEEIKSFNISDKVEIIDDASQNEKLNETNTAGDQQQSDISGNENLSSFELENNSDVSSDSNLIMPATEDLSNNVPKDDEIDLKDESRETENSVVSEHRFTKDIINEDNIIHSKETQEQVEGVDAKNILKNHNEIVSTYKNIQEFGCKSDINVLPEADNPDNASMDKSSETIFLSEEVQKHSYNPDNNSVIEDSHDTFHTSQEISESNHNLDTTVVENKEIKDTTENVNMCEHNFVKNVDEFSDIVPKCGEVREDASVSKENDHTNDNNKTGQDGNTSFPSKEMQKQDHYPDDDIVDKSVSEVKGTSEDVRSEFLDNSAAKEIVSRETLQKDYHNSDDTVKNASSGPKTDEVSSKIETPPVSEIEKNPEKKRGRKPKKKSCPKIKISVAKKMDNSGPASSKNWYVSERKESTDSTQSEEPMKKDNLGGSKRGRRKMTTKSSLPVNTLDKEEGVCFETVAEIHAVDTDTNSPFNEVSSELNIISDEVSSKNDASAFSSKVNKISSVVSSEVDSSNDTNTNEVSTTSTKSLTKRKSECLKPSTDSLVKIKEEPTDIDDSSASIHPDPIVHIKLENEDIAISTNELCMDSTSLSTKKKGRSSAAANKIQRFDETPVPNPVTIEDIKEPSSKGVTDSPSGQPSRKPKNLGTPASCPQNRKKSYSPEAVIVPFSLGWMRELVHRSTENRAGKRMSDVYYFSPEGTKLRSMIEISNYLSRRPECLLKIENFTFYKELVYREPFEIQRGAKQKSIFGTPLGKTETSNQTSIKKFLQSSTTPSSSKVKPQNTPVSSNLKAKTKTSISNSDINIGAIENEKSSKLPVKSSETTKGKERAEKSAKDSSSMMDTVESSESIGSRPSRKIARKVPFDNSLDDQSQPRPKRGRPSKSLDTSVSDPNTKIVDAMKSQIGSGKNAAVEKSTILSKNYSKSTTTKRRPKLKLVFSKNMNSGEIQPPCSPRCHIAAIQRPSVQCAICLCIFHPNCIPKLTEKLIFACKSCTTQKLALYEKERKALSLSESSLLPEDSISFDPDIDISLLAPEVILDVQTEPITFPSDSESNTLPKNSSYILQGLPRTTSSAAVKSLHLGNHTLSSPQLLSHLLQPTVLLNASRPANQNLNKSPSRLLLTKEAASTIAQFGVRFTPGTKISAGGPIIVNRLPDGRRIALHRPSNLLSPPNNINNSTVQNTVSNVNSNIQILSNISKQGNLIQHSNRINQTEAKLRPANFHSKDHAKNNSITTHFLANNRTGNEFNISKNPISSSKSSKASESFLSWDMNKLMTSSKSLLLVFKRLSVPDLLRARQVCSYWKYVASQSDLWQKVSFQGLTITNWEKCCLALEKNGTKALDLRGIVHQNTTNPWKELEINVVYLAGIEELIFDQITPSLLKNVAYNMPLLRKLECHFVTTACSEPEIWTVSSEWELSSLRYLGRLIRLKIGSGSRIELKNGEDYVMPYLPQLRHVALTGFNFCSNVNLESLSKQKELISLELGDCKEIEPGIYALLENLTSLKSLRLENGGNIDDYRLSEALLKIKGLEVLELMNFKISERLSEAFGNLKHLIHLNVWPDNTEKGAVVNRNLFNAISSCKDLKYLCWGVIAEGDYTPQFLEMENSNELTFENLFSDLVTLFPECRVEVKCAPRSSWREFCSTRK